MSVLTGDAHQQTLGDVVAVEAGTVDVENGFDELRCQLAHSVDRELHEQFIGVLLPHITDGQEDQEIVVGLSHLQERLTTFDIFHKVRCIAPDGVGGRHIDRGVELPARPLIVFR